MKTTRMTKLITAIVIATMLTGCAANAPTVTTETVDVTTYMIIDENEPTVTETVKNDDGTTTIITKTTDGSTVSIATTTTEATTTETEKETEATTKETSRETKATPTATTQPTATPTTEVKPTEPTATPTETTKPTDTPKPTETTKPTTQPTKPSEPTTKPSEPTTKPTTKPSEPTTKPSEPTTKPSEPTTKPTEPTTKPTTPAPVAKYNVIVGVCANGTISGTGKYAVGEKVTVSFTANSGYTYRNAYVDGTKVTKTSYTFTMPDWDVYVDAYFDKVEETQPTTKYYYAELDITFTVSFTDGNGNWHENEMLPATTVTVYDPNGNVSLKSKIYGYDSTRAFLGEYLNTLYPNATISGYGHTTQNLKNLRETL